MIEVEVYRGDCSTGMMGMLLDTGADISCLPSSLIAVLGIDAGSEMSAAETLLIGGEVEASELRYPDRPIMGRLRTGDDLVTEFIFPTIHFHEPRVDKKGRRRTAPAVIGCDALFGPFQLELERPIIRLRTKPES